MPIYEYQCQVCGERLEKLQSISSDPLKECPACGEPEGLKRLISQTSFVLKGTGWYATDYKSGGASASSSKNESAKPSASGSSTSESKGSSSNSSSSD